MVGVEVTEVKKPDHISSGDHLEDFGFDLEGTGKHCSF